MYYLLLDEEIKKEFRINNMLLEWCKKNDFTMETFSENINALTSIKWKINHENKPHVIVYISRDTSPRFLFQSDLTININQYPRLDLVMQILDSVSILQRNSKFTIQPNYRSDLANYVSTFQENNGGNNDLDEILGTLDNNNEIMPQQSMGFEIDNANNNGSTIDNSYSVQTNTFRQ
jgi:hypothetical protein